MVSLSIGRVCAAHRAHEEGRTIDRSEPAEPAICARTDAWRLIATERRPERPRPRAVTASRVDHDGEVRPLFALLLTVALLGACTDGDDGSAASTSTSTSTSERDAAVPTNDLPPVTGPFAPGRTPVPGFGEVEVRIVDGPDGEPIVLCVLLAETVEQRARGLMEVTDPDLGGYDGMLFVYDNDRIGGFYMKNTVLPLSIAYLDADGATVDALDMEPCPPDTETCPTYPPSQPYRSALEVPQGDLDALGLVPGSDARLEVSGPCAPTT